MPNTSKCPVVRVSRPAGDVLRVRPVGAPTPGTSTGFRSTPRASLADTRPAEAVAETHRTAVVDVARLMDADGIASTRSAALARAADARLGGPRPTGAAAVRWRRRRLPAAPTAVTSARVWAVAVCRDWGVPTRIAERVQVVVSELAANAVRHAGTAFDVVLRCGPRFVHVAVRDGSQESPRLRGPRCPSDESGRGLQLVEAFAARWGSTPTPDGKVTWATVRDP